MTFLVEPIFDEHERCDREIRRLEEENARLRAESEREGVARIAADARRVIAEVAYERLYAAAQAVGEPTALGQGTARARLRSAVAEARAQILDWIDQDRGVARDRTAVVADLVVLARRGVDELHGDQGSTTARNATARALLLAAAAEMEE